MSHYRILISLVGTCVMLLFMVQPSRGDDDSALARDLRKQRADLDQRIAANTRDVNLYSSRGDVLFFLGEFDGAVRDYDRMVELDPALDTSHWRRGIAWFYAGNYEEAAEQFNRYHSFDNVDRENGIWRYLCQVKAHGVESARQGLLKYEKDDREPFPDVYRLFAGDIKPQAIFERIQAADVNDTEREKRRFYAHLYIGLWHAVHNRPKQAAPHLEASTKNTWAPQAGYGPHYMWHVGRLHHQILAEPQASHSAGAE